MGKNPKWCNVMVTECAGEILPTGANEWYLACKLYKEKTAEDFDRDPVNMKRYFVKVICNDGKKITGRLRSSAPPHMAEGLRVQALILAKMNSRAPPCIIYVMLHKLPT